LSFPAIAAFTLSHTEGQRTAYGKSTLIKILSSPSPGGLNTSCLPPAELRVAVLLMMSVAAYKWFNIPHGYWIAFTILVVLQPDYGATRRKAGVSASRSANRQRPLIVQS
jgi:hypothetical protein